MVNPQLGSGLGLGLGLGLGSGLGLGLEFDSVRGSTISHKMKYLPVPSNRPHDRPATCTQTTGQIINRIQIQKETAQNCKTTSNIC